ncbi:DNA helicase RecQ [Pikeienuella piscinae]|uniref:DNA helicase RecQ n=1 Tax=Pikeienuella piscinae TaxID=2748098 RepID=A0A7L5BW51_9RHOB|nr:DNA helicase RecQ [Pikeienuella piscinae]QIE55363.1 DNA helicase RecQ [Pikeienuella piscinae]
MQPALDLLKSVFGFDAFRPGQAEIIEAILNEEDVLAIMPTGGGKSLCYQLPALRREGMTLVVSPLIALMRDQVEALRRLGVEAGALTSANDPEETERVFDAIDRGVLKLLYLAPERLGSAAPLIRRTGVSLLAVDEAHCVSQWGHDFRPDYLKIGALRAALGGPQTAAFTATADEETRAEIAAKLFAAPPRVFLRGFDRPNIHLAFAAKDGPRRQLLDFVTARKGRSGIVYASSRNKTEVLAGALRHAGLPALPYHAGLDPETRRDHQERFQLEDGVVMCATIAFGMGVDKPDIRYVVHADLPKSMESYYQEIGRAGRDGAPAETLTLYGLDDIRLQRMRIDESPAPNDRKRADHARLNALLALAEAPRCRRQILLGYFGEQSEPCGNCDLCDRPPALFDGTEAAQMALSAIYRTEERYGQDHIIAVLRGEATEKATRAGHDQLAVFGKGADKAKGWWRGVMRQIYALGLVRIDAERHGAWRLTDAARPVLRGEERIEIREDTLRAKAKRADRAVPAALVAEEDEALFSRLRALRARLAQEQGGPAYIVFSDRSLIDMTARKPHDLDQFAACHGVGAQKLARYGAAFLAAINETAEEPAHPARRRAATNGDGALFAALEEAQIALSRGVEGRDKFLACTRPTLAKIAEARPRSLEALAQISGVGPQKSDRFGAVFLSIISSADA